MHEREIDQVRASRPSGAFSAFTGVVMDITDQYLAAKKVERAEESLRLAIEAANSGSYLINTRTLEFTASPRLKELFGFKRNEDMSYEACMQQINEDYRPIAYRMVEAAISKGEPFELEYSVTGFHDGKQRWLKGVGTLQHDSRGQDSFFTGIITDITERKADEQRKNDFIGMVSHELKTPLTSLSAIIQVASAKLKNNGDAFLGSAMSKAQVQVKRMSSMINGFLNISRLESGKILIDKQLFNIEALIREIIDELKVTVATHTISLESCEPAEVYADRDKITQLSQI